MQGIIINVRALLYPLGITESNSLAGIPEILNRISVQI